MDELRSYISCSDKNLCILHIDRIAPVLWIYKINKLM